MKTTYNKLSLNFVWPEVGGVLQVLYNEKIQTMELKSAFMKVCIK